MFVISGVDTLNDMSDRNKIEWGWAEEELAWESDQLSPKEEEEDEMLRRRGGQGFV